MEHMTWAWFQMIDHQNAFVWRQSSGAPDLSATMMPVSACLQAIGHPVFGYRFQEYLNPNRDSFAIHSWVR